MRASMRWTTRWTTLALAAVVATPVVAGAQGFFEGIVTYQVSGRTGRTTTFDYYVKGNKAMFQSRDSGMTLFGSMIIDQDTKTRTMVVPSRKMYMTSPITDKMSARMDSSMHNAKLVKTGSETVAGVPCDDYTTVGGTANDSGTVCIAHGMGNFALMGMGSGGMMAEMAKHVQGFSDASSGGFFPLKWTSQRDSMVATKVEKKSLDPSLFQPPAGYTQMQLPAGAASRMQNP
jgi:hypothetical protein